MPRLKVDDQDDLQAQLDAANAKIAALEAAVPKVAVAKEGHQFIFISSRFASTTVKGSVGGKHVKKVVSGSVNGEPFEVECDKQVEVPDHVAGALKGLLDAQANG